jgi:hypothetical protein
VGNGAGYVVLPPDEELDDPLLEELDDPPVPPEELDELDEPVPEHVPAAQSIEQQSAS